MQQRAHILEKGCPNAWHPVYACGRRERQVATKKKNRMAFGAIIPSHLSALSVRQSLDLYKIYLENANRTKDHDIALVLCHEAKVALSQAKNANRKHPVHPLSIGNSQLREEMANAYINLGKLLEREGYRIEGQAVCRKAEKWG
jgi:hypothetical protein